jgi:hypothetical protein
LVSFCSIGNLLRLVGIGFPSFRDRVDIARLGRVIG